MSQSDDPRKHAKAAADFDDPCPIANEGVLLNGVVILKKANKVCAQDATCDRKLQMIREYVKFFDSRIETADICSRLAKSAELPNDQPLKTLSVGHHRMLEHIPGGQ
jgi:hypothetical protein